MSIHSEHACYKEAEEVMKKLTLVLAVVSAVGFISGTASANPIETLQGVPAYVPGVNTYQDDMLFDDNTAATYSVARDGGGNVTGIVLPSFSLASSGDPTMMGIVGEFRSIDAFSQPKVIFDLTDGPHYNVDLTLVMSRITVQSVTPMIGGVVGDPLAGGHLTFDPNFGQIWVAVRFGSGEYALWADTSLSDYDHNATTAEGLFDPTGHPWDAEAVIPAGHGADAADDGTVWLQGTISNTTAVFVFQGVDLDRDGQYDEAYLTTSLTTMDLPVTGGAIAALVDGDPFVTANLDSRLGSLGHSGYLPDATWDGSAWIPAQESDMSFNGFELGDTPNLTIRLVPEPSTMLLLTSALIGLALRRRKR